MRQDEGEAGRRPVSRRRSSPGKNGATCGLLWVVVVDSIWLCTEMYWRDLKGFADFLLIAGGFGYLKWKLFLGIIVSQPWTINYQL